MCFAETESYSGKDARHQMQLLFLLILCLQPQLIEFQKGLQSFLFVLRRKGGDITLRNEYNTEQKDGRDVGFKLANLRN